MTFTTSLLRVAIIDRRVVVIANTCTKFKLLSVVRSQDVKIQEKLLILTKMGGYVWVLGSYPRSWQGYHSVYHI